MLNRFTSSHFELVSSNYVTRVKVFSMYWIDLWLGNPPGVNHLVISIDRTMIEDDFDAVIFAGELLCL